MTLLSVLWLLSAGQVVTPPAMDEAERQRQAKVLLDEALKRYGAAQYESAIESFKAAYALAPAPGLLFNIAQAYRLWGKGHCLDAQRTYRTYLQASPEAPNREKVETQLKGLERCARDEEHAPAPATEPPKPPAELPKPAPEPAKPPPPEPVSPPAASEPASPEPHVTAPPSATAPPPQVELRPSRPARWPALVLGFAGIAALGVGGGFYGWSGQEYAGFQTQCAGGQCDPKVWEPARTHEQEGLALLGVGAAAVVAGAIWWLLVSGVP